MLNTSSPRGCASLRPQTQALALEPRIMFDGAVAASVDQHHADAARTPDAAPAEHVAAPVEARPAPTQAPSVTRELLVIDARLQNSGQLAAAAAPNVSVLLVQPGQDGLAAISQALARLGSVDSVQILSHGAPGQFTLGDRTIGGPAVDRLASGFEAWRPHLAPGADIQIYGCNAGAGASGRLLVDDIARWTGADVGASLDNTGSADAGGNWTLEVRDGVIDHALALTATGEAAYHGLLLDAAPTVTLSSGGTDVLLGDQLTFTASFSNTSTQDGYAPFIDVFMPATGKDGNDGVSFVAATYLGQAVKAYVTTFDAQGNATHPLAVGADGQSLVLHAADYGLRAGDQLVVLQLPYASVSRDQPSIDVQITAHLSNLADTAFSDGSPDLTIIAQAAFQLGNDSLNNPAQDPSILEATTHAFVVHPTVVTLTQTVDAPEGKTPTGPNYGRVLTVTTDAAPGQTLTDVLVEQTLPADILVTSITPGAGGTLRSVTLANGSVLTVPVEIQVALAAGAYVSAYSVEYASLTGSIDTVVRFYVPETDAGGVPVLDATSGAPSTVEIAGPTATAEWTPLDPRDVVAPGTGVALSGTGADTGFLIESLALYKDATLQVDAGTAGLSPGDVLAYTISIDLSDYFAFGKNVLQAGEFVVRDTAGDGQVLNGAPTISITMNGVTRSIALVTTTVVNPDGTTSLVFDIGQSIYNANQAYGGLAGDLAFDSARQGATRAVISYSTVIAQAYTTPYPQSEINEGDSVGNAATVEATVLLDTVNLGGTQTDSDTRTVTVPTNTVDIDIDSVNGGAVPADGELQPGDTVTFTISYDLVTGDYEQLTLEGYLPLPLFNLSGLTFTQGNGAGQWHYGVGNTNAGGVVSVTVGPGNALIFDFGSYATAITTGSRIEVQFTLTVGDQPFADQRPLSVLATSDQLTTIDQTHLRSSDAAVISSIAEPALTIVHGVVSSSNGTVTGTLGNWAAPGSGGAPFTGSILTAQSVDGTVAGIDGSDLLRLATAIKNNGGGDAFDVSTDVVLPSGLTFAGGSLAAANLRIYRGDGTALVLGTDYAVTGNTITFLDANGQGTVLGGRNGTANDTSGANVVVITYDVVVDASIAASRTLQSSGVLTHYASAEGGDNFASGVTESAIEQVAAPTASVVYAGGSLDNTDSSAGHTNGSDLVVGESMLYDIVVTLPEGGTQTLRIDDLIPAGLRLDTSFNGTGYQIITTTGGTTALVADFNGTVTLLSLTGSGGTLGGDGVDGRFTFSVSGATADNATGNNSFVIRVRLVASNVTANQAGRSLQNQAQLVFSDPDGDTPNGAAPLDRTVAGVGVLPTVVIREPTLIIEQTTDPLPPLGVDETVPVTYQIVIRNASSTGDFSAFDVTFDDTLPSQLSGYSILGVTYTGNATNHGGPDFVIENGVLHTVNGAKLDIPPGGSIVIRVTGIVNATAAAAPTFDNTATVHWTSLDGANAGERTGAEGLLGSGVLNDYSAATTVTVPVLRGLYLSRVGGLPSTSAGDPTDAPDENVTVGEVIHYRTVGAIAQGAINDFTVRVVLPNGIGFINDGSVRIAFISNGGVTSSIVDLTTGGTLNVNGDQSNGMAMPLDPTLSGPLAGGVLNPSQITVSVDANGNTVITFHLGNLTNTESDSDLELYAIEFNARVLNQASNVAGAALGAVASESTGSTLLSTSQTVVEHIVEPSFGSLNKQIVDFVPNVTASTGTASVVVGFVQTGGSPAYDVVLADSFAGGTSYTFTGLTINGTAYTLATLPAGVAVDLTNGVRVTFAQLNPGDRISFSYGATVPDLAPVPGNNASLTWTSLPQDFTSWGGSAVGTAGNADGERTGAGTAPNTYVLSEGAGLGVISGSLWDDTASATTSVTPDGTALAGLTVTLTWAGLDGSLATTADNRTYTAVTDAAGHFSFGALPAGVFRIDTPASASFAQPLGDLHVRIDSDAATPLGQIVVTLGEGVGSTANAGYVHQNVAPAETLPGTRTGLEDVPLAIGGISVSDVDAGNGDITTTLGVLHGSLALSGVPAGVTVTGGGTSTLSLTGSVANINAALALLQYTGNQDYNGTDTLTVTTADHGNFGDADGDGTPGENPQDQLTTAGTVAIVLAPVNDPPTAVADVADAVEAGGTANSTTGVDPKGNLLRNDVDVDMATNGDFLTVTGVQLLPGGAVVAPVGNGEAVVVGLYGTLHVLGDGGYEYIVDNANPLVQALRNSGQTLTEQFSYTAVDTGGLTEASTLTVTIHGANDTPVAANDTGVADEQGGVLNSSGGNDAVGNVLVNDTDVDSTANGEVRTVIGIRAQPESGTGPAVAVAPGTTSASGGTVIAGLYGTLTIGADGSYVYRVDNTNATVQGLIAGETLVDDFSYAVQDAGGLTDIAQITITVRGANDNPVATDDIASAQAASTDDDTRESNPSGNVITFASRPGNPTDPGGNGIDYDVDHTDRPDSLLQVDGVSAGQNVAGPLGGIGTVTGAYGTLTLAADGTYSYNVDSTNAAVIALSAGQTLTEVFTYEIVDTEGLTARANLTITVHGAQDPPVAQNVDSLAIEAGGVNNGTAGLNPTGDATNNSSDPDGDPITVSGIRTGSVGGTGVAGTIGTGLAGTYGTLTVRADGTYSYIVDNANPLVQALRTSLNVIEDRFTFTITDGQGAFSSAEIHVFISGQNDNPVGTDDTASALEAGGRANGQAGTDPAGNVLANDTDVDAGDQHTVISVRTGAEVAAGTAGTLGTELRGMYGWLTLAADGTYSYRVDNTLAAVQALRQSGDTLSDVFTYGLADRAGATDLAALTVVIHGNNDAPVADDDTATAVEAGGVDNGTPGVAPTGNVLTNDTDVDANGEALRVTQVSHGGNNASAGTSLAGTYGTLTLRADGSYTYVVDDTNGAVQALRLTSDHLVETFTYAISDVAGATDSATLTITIVGANDAPHAVNDGAIAIEAGGVDNDIPGFAPAGNLLHNDTDVDANDTQTVSGIRTGGLTDGGVFAAVGGSTQVTGTYGKLTLGADGAYSYHLDDAAANVQALMPGQTVVETFTYQMHDAAGALSAATLTIVITGRNDAPVATPEVASATEAGGVDNGTAGIDPTGSVLNSATDVDANGVPLQVTQVGNGTVDGNLGLPLAGRFGSLTLQADGSYRYIVDNGNAQVQALRQSTDQLLDLFTYTVTDQFGATASSTLLVVIHGANDNPAAGDDIVDAFEAGGRDNTLPGVNPGGNVFRNDVDVDGEAYGETATVVGVRTGAETGTGAAGTVGTELRGMYGWLTIAADGTASYRLDNDLPAVQALRTATDTLQEVFTYTLADTDGATDAATITIVIHGANDSPVAVDDTAVATEAGGVANATPGSNPSGNVLVNDSDVDGVTYGEHIDVTGVGSLTGGIGFAGNPVSGRYGSIVIRGDGSYDYVLDNLNPAVQALRTPQDTLTEVFLYTISDAAGATSQARLTITIHGANDAPVAIDDAATAVETGGIADATPGADPSGNVLANDTDVDASDTRTVNGIRAGTEASGAAPSALNGVTQVAGTYGTLTIGPDGEWHYVLDNTLPAVEALLPGQTLSEVFTYRVVDTLGATDLAELRITIAGRNDTPQAHDDAAVAIEAGGVANGTVGVDPSGNVLDNDTDMDGIARGETHQVQSYVSPTGSGTLAGQALPGFFGSLSIDANGRWHYTVDNANPAVQGLRTAADTLTETYVYTMRDANGATSQARLTITIQGANDNPVAANDSGAVNDQTAPPEVVGHVLPNDSDVDAGDVLTVVGIRTGAEGATGVAGTVGQSLAGRYGTLTLGADGSYRYVIDLNNPEVLAVSGLGAVLQDVFTYTISDLAGATDAAELVIHLDISAPFIPPREAGPNFGSPDENVSGLMYLPDVDPKVFVGPVVAESEREVELSTLNMDGARPGLIVLGGDAILSPGAGLGDVPGQFVGHAIAASRRASDVDLATFLARHGRVSLTADGLLPDPSIFASTPAGLHRGEFAIPEKHDARTARSFHDQVRQAARRGHTSGH